MKHYWKNALLYPKRSGYLDRRDLDAYDSELAQDLYAIHDIIINNPVRDYDRSNPLAENRYFNYTFNVLSNKLLPAIEKASKGLIGHEEKEKIDYKIITAQVKLQEAKICIETGNCGNKATLYLEEAFSSLHSAIDIIRYATRETPPVRSLRPAFGVK